MSCLVSLLPLLCRWYYKKGARARGGTLHIQVHCNYMYMNSDLSCAIELMKGTSSLLWRDDLTLSWFRVTSWNLSHWCWIFRSLSGWATCLSTAGRIFGIKWRSTVDCSVCVFACVIYVWIYIALIHWRLGTSDLTIVPSGWSIGGSAKRIHVVYLYRFVLVMSDLQGPSWNQFYLSFGMSYARETSCIRYNVAHWMNFILAF